MSQKFESYYSEFYKERWSALRDSLSRDQKLGYIPSQPQTEFANLVRHTPGQMPERLENGLLKEYFMDPASILVAQMLPLEKAERVLDMCAAPGGKSLVLISRLAQNSATFEFIANEVSHPRREALTKVIQNYIPMEQRKNIWVKGQDGVKFGMTQPESFDAILLDAPCSGEAHLLENKKELENWSPQRTKGLAIKQYSLLSSAWNALKPGGYVLYSTCSISPLENDGVIEKLLKKKDDEAEIIHAAPALSPERTRYGFQYFPDQFGFGPLYAALVKKREI
jgi:16S rRNA C967 or C1407 C5-methylase (RsmB/RsmF family)